jgi:hypothetical protein
MEKEIAFSNIKRSMWLVVSKESPVAGKMELITRID